MTKEKSGQDCYYSFPMSLLIKVLFSWYSCNMMLSNKESLNLIETFINLYVPVDCPEQDYVDFEIPVFIVKTYLINA